jgi:LPXTG-site transpeptidase (sortase) family protein
MTDQLYLEEKPHKKSFRSTLVSLVMILAGALVAILAMNNWIQEWRANQSPFDVIASSNQPETGFLPLFTHEEKNETPHHAPTLSAAVDHETLIPGAENQEAGAATPTPTRLENLRPFGSSSLGDMTELDWIPDRIRIPSINLDAPIVPVHLREIEVGKDVFEQWVAPDLFAAGWHDTSATLGVPGNTVLNGHHNIFEEVFRDIHKLKEGSLIILYSGEKAFTYRVGLNIILEERYKPLETRLANAQWILPSDDERITLITCWPYTSNTHRVVVVAVPTTMSNGEFLE